MFFCTWVPLNELKFWELIGSDVEEMTIQSEDWQWMSFSDWSRNFIFAFSQKGEWASSRLNSVRISVRRNLILKLCRTLLLACQQHKHFLRLNRKQHWERLCLWFCNRWLDRNWFFAVLPFGVCLGLNKYGAFGQPSQTLSVYFTLNLRNSDFVAIYKLNFRHTHAPLRRY